MQNQILISREKVQEAARIMGQNPSSTSVVLNEDEYTNVNELAKKINEQYQANRARAVEMNMAVNKQIAAQGEGYKQGLAAVERGLAEASQMTQAQQQRLAPGILCDSLPEMVERVMQSQENAPPEYDSKPVRAIKLTREYFIGEHRIPAGDYLVEASSSEGPKWVPMEAKYFETNYKSKAPRSAHVRIYEAVKQMLHSESGPLDLADQLGVYARKGFKVVWYNPEVEDCHITLGKGECTTIRRADIRVHNQRVEGFLKLIDELKEKMLGLKN